MWQLLTLFSSKYGDFCTFFSKTLCTLHNGNFFVVQKLDQKKNIVCFYTFEIYNPKIKSGSFFVVQKLDQKIKTLFVS
jgi:hypothetical protein